MDNPFVESNGMNSQGELAEAFERDRAGKMGGLDAVPVSTSFELPKTI
jgi:hypothetical protein